MSWNFASSPPDERQAREGRKARLFKFWPQNHDRAKGEAGKLFAERSKRQGRWKEWALSEAAQISPLELKELVRRELTRLEREGA